MASNKDSRTEELSKSSLDLSSIPRSNVAILRCVDTSVLRGPGGREIKLSGGEITVGRGTENSVSVDGTGMSRVHARVYFANGSWQVEDLGSTNGTRVNNSSVTTAPLSDGDTLAFGRVCYKFMKLDPVKSSRTLDLGVDRTLVLGPNELPIAAAAAAAEASTNRTAPAPRAAAAARPRAARTAAASNTGLGTWLVVALIALVVVVGAMTLLG